MKTADSKGEWVCQMLRERTTRNEEQSGTTRCRQARKQRKREGHVIEFELGWVHLETNGAKHCLPATSFLHFDTRADA